MAFLLPLHYPSHSSHHLCWSLYRQQMRHYRWARYNSRCSSLGNHSLTYRNHKSSHQMRSHLVPLHSSVLNGTCYFERNDILVRLTPFPSICFSLMHIKCECVVQHLPIFTKNTLNHFVLDVILFVWIWSMAHAIHTRKVLIVRIFVVVIHFVGVQFTANRQYLRCATIAPEISLCVQLDQVVTIVTLVTACQAYASTFFWLVFRFGDAC